MMKNISSYKVAIWSQGIVRRYAANTVNSNKSTVFDMATFAKGE